MDDEGVFSSTNVLTIQQNDDMMSPVQRQSKNGRAHDPPFQSNDRGLTTGTNLKVETEGITDEHYETGKLKGIKKKMEEEHAK